MVNEIFCEQTVKHMHRHIQLPTFNYSKLEELVAYENNNEDQVVTERKAEVWDEDHVSP